MHTPLESDREVGHPSETTVDAAASPKPKLKQSYERSPEVRRWLEDHAVERDGVKPEFDPQFLANRRDRDWLLSSLAHFYHEDLIADVLHQVSSGKEATVYCCRADPATGADLLAAKVYRPRMFRSLSNDAVYRQSRVQRDMDGRIMRGGRTRGSPGQSKRGRSAQISSWITFEFETQQLLHAAGADVPRVWSHIGNAVLMDYVGAVDDPAPRLQDVELDAAEAQPLFDTLLRNVELCLACDRIHGDLSAYNILYWDGSVTLIDFAQALDPRHNPDVFGMLHRDIDRVYRYFAPYGVEADPVGIATDLWSRYLRGRL